MIIMDIEFIELPNCVRRVCREFSAYPYMESLGVGAGVSRIDDKMFDSLRYTRS